MAEIERAFEPEARQRLTFAAHDDRHALADIDDIARMQFLDRDIGGDRMAIVVVALERCAHRRIVGRLGRDQRLRLVGALIAQRIDVAAYRIDDQVLLVAEFLELGAAQLEFAFEPEHARPQAFATHDRAHRTIDEDEVAGLESATRKSGLRPRDRC